jgi:hypothetical protein
MTGPRFARRGVPARRRLRRAALVVSLAAASVTAGARPAAAEPPDGFAPLRALYLAAVTDEAAIARGLDEVAIQRARLRPADGAHVEATLAAYEGALITLRAKHASWPPRKLQHLRQGLAVLDAVIAAHPDHAEARYLRLMSCYYLPAILGRAGSVREDFAALARLLPGVRSQYPADLYRAIATFVLEKGAPTPAERAGLERSLAAGDG